MTLRRRVLRRLLNLERFEARLTPATFVVDNLSFSSVGNSLRALVNAANNNPGPDTITFAPGLTGTITFTVADDMDINGPLAIIGPGSGVITINANGQSRIFDTSVSPAGTAISISGLTLTGGRAKFIAPGNAPDISGVGGAIYVDTENVSLFDCKITGNTADKSGGGIGIGEHVYLGSNVGGSVTVESSSITGNTANSGGGGGISAYGESFDQYASRYHSLTVKNTVISSNVCISTDSTTLVGGGGISFRGKVGPGQFNLINATITDNQALAFAAGGGMWLGDLDGVLSIFNSTVAYNKSSQSIGGGLRFEDRFMNLGAAQLNLHSSIVANNTSVDGATKQDISSKFVLATVANFSLIGVSDKGNFDISGANNLLGTGVLPLDAKLAPLANNGGPGLTRMPLATSPAIAQGSDTIGLTTDGRGAGYPRSLDGKIDIGAVEFTDWVVRSSGDKGPGTLSQRIADANLFVGTQTITFDPAQFSGLKTVKVPANTSISDGLTVVGTGSLTITPGNVGRTFDARSAPPGAVINFSGITFEAGSVPGLGGVIVAKNQTLNFTDCTFLKNQATSGGAIGFESGAGNALNLLRCTFETNLATSLGGAVYFENGGQFAIDDSTFSNNSTTTGNSTTQGGGAIAFVGTAAGPTVIRRSTLAANTSAGQGGAIFVTSFAGTLDIEQSTIASNSAAGSLGGGGIGRTASSGVISLDHTILSNNTNSGGIHPDIFSSGVVTASSSAIGSLGNTALTGDATTTSLLGKNFRLGTLANYGGTTKTIPLLPGSPCLNAGSIAITADQRGKAQFGLSDIGDFESQGFNLSVVSGTPQSTVTNTSFISPLVTQIAAINAAAPVNGGVIRFTAPVSGASATFGAPDAVIASGSASTTATANSIGGTYNVTATAGSSSVNFALTNKVLEAPSLIVTTTADVVDNFDLKTSLREAVNFSNSKVGVDVITFDPSVFASSQTIALTTGELVVNDAVTITGPGAALTTLSGSKVGRVFNTSGAASGAAVSVSGLTITGGQTLLRGGAVFADDQVITFTDCVLTGNSSGAGGAIAFDITTAGRLVLQRTTISNNTSTFGGGGIYFFGGGSFLIQNSTLSGNRSNSTISGNGGGAVYFNGGGGSKTLEVRNSTLSGNTALSDGGGLCIRNHAGSLYMVNSTVANNTASGSQGGGGIAQVNSTAGWIISSCIISNNNHTAGTSEDLFNVATGFSTLDSCAIGTTTGTSGLTLTPTTQALLGQNFLLTALGNFGGSTQTHALLPGSPAINKGTNNLGLATDQRGQSRVAVGAPDIGAFESQGFTVSLVSGSPQTTKVSGAFANPLVAKVTAVNATEPVNGGVVTFAVPGSGASATLGSPAAVIAAGLASTTATANGTAGAYNVSASVAGSSVNFALTNLGPEAPSLVVTTSADVVDNFDYKTSLREALAFANSTPGAATITFDSTVFATPQTITLGSALSITDALTITGPGAKLASVSGNNASRVIGINIPGVGGVAQLSGLTITGGNANRGGGIIVGDDALTLTDCVVSGNKAIGTETDDSGGGVLLGSGGSLLAVRSTFSNNTSANTGGAIATPISGVGSVILDGCAVSGNTAFTNGGGIYFRGTGAGVTIRNSTFSNNSSSTASGSAVWFFSKNLGGSANLTIQNSTITANTAGFAGAVNIDPSALLLESSIVSGNVAPSFANVRSSGTVTAKSSALGDATGIINFVPDATTTALLGQNFKLGALANNGGPTQTIALLPGSPLINAGSNPGNLSTDQRGAGFLRVVGTAADIGAFEKQDVPRGITGVAVNDGSAQRSRVTSLKISFDQPVTLPVNPADAFQLQRQSDSAAVTLAANVAGNVVTLTFTGGPVDFGSLADGRYTLTALASKINGGVFDGNGDGTAGDDYTLIGTPANGLFRLFGDVNGNGQVGTDDFLAFRLAFLSSSPTFDFTGNGTVDAADFLQFRLRFLSSV